MTAPIWENLPQLLVISHQTDQAALDFNPLLFKQPGLKFRIGGFKRNQIALTAKAFEGGFFIIDADPVR